jgi:hypothetical protein
MISTTVIGIVTCMISTTVIGIVTCIISTTVIGIVTCMISTTVFGIASYMISTTVIGIIKPLYIYVTRIGTISSHMTLTIATFPSTTSKIHRAR